MPQIALTLDQQITEQVAAFYDKPLEYVMWNYPWDSDPAIQMVPLQEPYKSRFNCEYGPDVWACEFLDELGSEIKKRRFDGKTAVEPIRFSTSSGHGIGKSTLVAWLIQFILDTRPYSMGMVTANTSDQLRTKTWAELAKWHHISLTSHLWKYNNSRGNMSLYRRGNEAVSKKWRCDALTAKAENAEAFQGLHAANSTPFYIFDEASGIEAPIWEARQGGATDGEPMSFDFGNPTRKSGWFYENTVGKYRHRFITKQIDSRSCFITNKGLFKQWADDWGEDSDLFKVKVRGVFPSAGNVQFIATDLVQAAMMRMGLQNKKDPLIIGVDVARYGDNFTVIYPRLGMDAKTFPFRKYNGLDGAEVAERVIDMVREFQALGKNVDAIFIDGGGLGASPYDFLRKLGYNPIDINFGGRVNDQKYRFKGDEMWGKMREAIHSRLALPNDNELRDQLTQREYGITASGGRINLESKDMMKARGVESPDIADALALTFAGDPASSFDKSLMQAMPQYAKSDYNPLEG